jgi:hypothetical protein
MFLEALAALRTPPVRLVQSGRHSSASEERAAPYKVSAQKRLRVDISTVGCRRVEQARVPMYGTTAAYGAVHLR